MGHPRAGNARPYNGEIYMKHLFIINPAAGSRNRTEEYSEIIHKICRSM